MAPRDARDASSRGPAVPLGVKPALLIAVLGTLMAFGPMAIDMYLPALPAIGSAFAASQEAVQWTLSIFLLGFGLGQLAWGPLGDRFGRRWPAAAGILLYGAGSVGCALAPGMGLLIACRLLQALGASAAPVLARAMVRDVYDRDRAARMLSLMMLVMGIAPMLAPVVGGAVMGAFHWRAIFWVLVAFGAFALAGLFLIPETLPPARRSEPQWSAMLGAYRRLLADRAYVGYALTGGFMFAAMFAYIAGTPFVYIQHFGVSPQGYGLLFGLNVVSLMLGNLTNSQIVLRFGADRILSLTSALGAAFGSLLLVVGVSGLGGLAGIVVALFLFMSMVGVTGANAMVGALSAFPEIAGSASALAGTVQFALGAVAGWLVGALSDGTPAPMTAVIAAMSACSLLSFLLLVRSRRARADGPAT